MTLFDTIKSLSIFFAPILIPRAISLFRSARQSLAQHRHTPREPLSAHSSRALNILFLSAALFLLLSLPLNPTNNNTTNNIFTTTSSRLSTPTDLLFTRLARLRPLTPTDTLLRTYFPSPHARKTYLRFGPATLLSCPFCTPQRPHSYLLYHIPLNVLLPHLVHLLALGAATSAPLVGRAAARWRGAFVWAALVVLLADLGVVATWDPYGEAGRNTVVPRSVYVAAYTVRMLGLVVFDALCAGLVYVSATRRLFGGGGGDAAGSGSGSAEEQIEEFAGAVAASLTSAMGKVHALGLVRNAILRDAVLKRREDAVWMEIVGGRAGVVREDGMGVLDDEEVVRAVSRALAKRARDKGDGGSELDIMKKGMEEATQFVEGITAGLELED